MKTNLVITKLVVSLFICSVLMTGCIEKNGYNNAIRYQNVQIPGYEISDYENFLSSENDDIKYNAICYLIEHAGDYATILKKENSKISTPKEEKPTKEEIQNAKKILDSILRELKSKNENIKIVSLIFITEFSQEYLNKEKLFKEVEKVKAKKIRVQYEQIRALIELSNSKTKIDNNLIVKYLDSKSWFISSMAYLLLGKISSEDFHKKLIKKYNNTTNEYDKLLILHAFSNAYNPESFPFIKNEIISNNSHKIKQKAISILNKNNDKTQIANWIVSEHKTIDKEIIESILEEYYAELESTTGTLFFNELLLSNQSVLFNKIDQNKFFAALYSARRSQPKLNELADLEIKVNTINIFNQAWLGFKNDMSKKELKEQEKQKKEQEFEKTVLPQYVIMLEKFHEETKKLFTDAGMDKDEVENVTKEIKEFLELIKEDKSKE